MRTKGALNKDKRIPLELSKRLGVDPLEVLLLISGGNWKKLGYKKSYYIVRTGSGSLIKKKNVPLELRLSAASSACKYIYAQLKSVEAKVKTSSGARPCKNVPDDILDHIETMEERKI